MGVAVEVGFPLSTHFFLPEKCCLTVVLPPSLLSPLLLCPATLTLETAPSLVSQAFCLPPSAMCCQLLLSSLSPLR